MAVAVTSLIVTLFILESRYGVFPEGPRITYAADWSNSRTDAEIIAQQKIDQRGGPRLRRRFFLRLDCPHRGQARPDTARTPHAFAGWDARPVFAPGTLKQTTPTSRPRA